MGVIDLRVSAFANHYMLLRVGELVRRLGAERQLVPLGWRPALESFATAVESLRTPLDGWAMDCFFVGLHDLEGADPDRLARALHRPWAPEPWSDPPVDRMVDAVSTSIASTRDEFITSLWPTMKAALDAATTRVRKDLAHREQQCLRFICDSLHLESNTRAHAVYLVETAPRPGAYSGQGPSDSHLSVAAVRAHPERLLTEVVLHEVVHQIEGAPAGLGKVDSVMRRLRGALLELEGHADREILRELPHMLVFVQAAEAVRRFIDPDHVDYGLRGNYYLRLGPTGAVVRDQWLSVLRGECSDEAALGGMVAAAQEMAGSDHPI